MIKNFFKTVTIIIMLILTVSCRSSKDIIMMKDIMEKEKIPYIKSSMNVYRLQPGDVLYVSIKSMDAEVTKLFNPETSMEGTGGSNYGAIQRYSTPQGAYLYGYEINAEGNIFLPVIGQVNILDLSEQEVLHKLQEVVNDYLNDAIVKVKLLSYYVTVLGEVKDPGIYYNYSNSFSILDAIAMANGNNDFANLKNVLIIRKAEDFHQTYRINLQSKDSWQSEAFYLHPDDYVIVEPAKNKNLYLNSQGFSMIVSTLGIILSVIALKL